MTKVNINDVSAEVKALLKDMKLGETQTEQARKLAQPKLQLIWHALEAKQVVDGCKTKKEWAKSAGRTPRYCQLILKGERGAGSAKKRTMVRGCFLGRIAEAKEKVGVIQRAYDAPFKPGEVKDSKVLDQIDPIIAPVFKEFLKLISPEGYEMNQGTHGRFFLLEAFENDPVTPAIPVKKLSANDTKVAIQKFEEDFKRENKDDHSEAWAKKYSEAFDAEVAIKHEWRQRQVEKETERIENMIGARHIYKTPKKKVKRYSQNVHPGFMTMPGKPHKTHKMQPDGKRTWCGKRPGETLAIEARMSDNPTCQGCRNGENTDILRKTQVTVVVKDSTDAPVPYDTEAYAKAETVGQKQCIIGSPENLKWHADLEYRRNNPVVDPNADDEFAGERD